MPESTTIPRTPHALSYILNTLSLWKVDNKELQATYQYTDLTNTHSLLLQPASLLEEPSFLKKVNATILKFYELFPNEGIILTGTNKSSLIKNGLTILSKEGFHLSVEMMRLILSGGGDKTADIPVGIEVIEEI